MNNETLIQNWHSEDVHDGWIRRVEKETDRLRVFIVTIDGRRVVFEFTGVREVKHNRPEGMLLYALSELREVAPLRRFSFVNWEEEDDGYLEVVALEFQRTGPACSRDEPPLG